MKKIYQIPTISVINIQTTQILAGSDLNYKETTTDATSGNLSRRRGYWDDDDSGEE